MSGLLLPLLFIFIPFLVLLYLAAEIYLSSPRKALNRLTALFVLTYGFHFFGDYLMNVLPLHYATMAALYIKYFALFLNLSLGLYFVQMLCKTAIRPALLHVSSLLPLVGLLCVWSGSSWFELSVVTGPVFRLEEKSAGLGLLALIVSGYSTTIYLINTMQAYRKLKLKPMIVKERKRIKMFIKAFVIVMVWIVLAQAVLKPLLGANHYAMLDILTAYSTIFYCFAIRYAVVHYDFLLSTEKRYEILFHDTRGGIVIYDEQLRMVDANPAYLRMIGIDEPSDISWKNAPITDYIILDCDQSDDQIIQAVMTNKPIDIETRITNRLQISYDVDMQMNIFEMEGQIYSFVLIKDITEKKKNEQMLIHMAYHDPLTGLVNRRRFNEKLTEELERLEDTDVLLAVLLIDLDQFKWINDTLGHSAGDELLCLVKARLEEVVPANGCVARMGGDEFVVLLTGLRSAYEAEALARELINQIRIPYMISNNPFHVTASIGISLAPLDGADAESLIRNADAAMYGAKKGGRDRFLLFKPGQRETAEWALVLVNGLQTAMKNNEFTLQYQPQIDLRTGRLIGVEALLRWHSAVLGQVSPADFIPIAEETDAIVPIGEWVLRTAIIQGKLWIESGRPNLVMSVNISARQFKEPGFVHRLVEMLKEYDFPAANLCLEMTESMAISHLEQTLQVCREIAQLGISLAIDDFGTGYSALGMLSRFPFQTVKIDKSLIRDIGLNGKDAAVFQTIMNLTHHLEMEVLAEGVETIEQLEMLRHFGCDLVQGYLYGRPMPAGKIDVILADDQIYL